MDKTYSPYEVEDRLYQKSLEKGCFAAKIDKCKMPYSIVIPPPNVTGVLTMGHVLNNTIQDILARRERQKGKSVLWLPGTDHAGIATQTKVEESLRKEGRTRKELGRENFLEHAALWRDKHGGIILRQLKKLGCSCDWGRNAHTLDQNYSDSVIHAFVKLYKKGYLYRGQRMVNWCPSSLTALSDEEVVMKPQKSILYKIRYEIVETPGSYLEVSTTRPETIVGDVALAIHPEDPRWRNLKGLHAMRPINPMAIPIVADKAVQKDFGTGILKITPAHDKLDFEIAQRHDLPLVEILNPDGTLNQKAGYDFMGLERFSARKLIANQLQEKGILIEKEEYENNVGFSERADVPVEPRLSEQWFLKYPRVEEAKQVVKEGLIQFFPKRWEKTYLHWLDNIQDWCISRQLWWGHRIPVWYRRGENRSDPSNLHVSVRGPADPENWEQDEDVLDTWASSWLWPLATLGWPEEEEMEDKGLDYFYPTSTLVTGPDIIFFWVARMIMAGLEFRGPSYKRKERIPKNELAEKIPFRKVCFTGIIRDSKGRKMSKSLGNSPDPLDLIAKYGADGLRHGIMSIAPKGQDIRFSEERIEQGRNFCNKLWNVSRFRRNSGPIENNSRIEMICRRIQSEFLDVNDQAILLRVAETMDEVERIYSEFEFNSVLQSIYRLFWSDFCDWYVEVSKSRIKEDFTKDSCLAIQDLCLRQILLLLHPFIPFITEELWSKLGFSAGDSIQFTKPESGVSFIQAIEAGGVVLDRKAMQEMEKIRELVTQLRGLKAERNLSKNKQIAFSFFTDDENAETILQNETSITTTVGASGLKRLKETPDGKAALVTRMGSFYLDLSTEIDREAEKARLEKEIDGLKKIIETIQSRLSNKPFLANAPPHIVEGAKFQLIENQAKLKKNQDSWASISNVEDLKT